MGQFKLRSTAVMYIDELNNIRYSSDFEVVVGKITDEFRFIPNSSMVQEQGLTPEMLVIIAELIKTRSGIGEKRKEWES